MILYIVASLIIGLAICLLAGRERPWLVQGAYVAVLLASLVTAAKLTPLTDGVVVSVAVGLYSMSFLLTDYLGEIYGRKKAMSSVAMATVGALILLIAIQFSVRAPAAAFYGDQEAYSTILGTAPRLVLASVLAFVGAQIFDVTVFHKIKEWTGDRFLFLRNNLSTFGGQTVDTVIFYTIGFWGLVPNIFELVLITCLVKFVIALLDTPFLYVAVAAAKKKPS